MTYPAGIDVSAHQATTPPLAGLAFLFARATYGTRADVRYAEHVAHARAAGLVVGAYHFGRNLPVPDQVAAFLAAAGTVDYYALDLESDRGNPPMTLGQARAFIAAVKATGRKIGLYRSESGFPSAGQDWNWVANWSAAPRIPWLFHQHRGAPLDLDRFNGTPAQLRGQPATHTLRVAAGATVRVYTLGKAGCITSYAERTWGRRASTARASAKHHRETCDGQSGAMVVRVLSGTFAGRYVRVGSHGVTLA